MMNRLRWLKAYPTLLRANFAVAAEYRARTIVWILSSVLPLVMMMVWLTVAEQQGGQVAGYNRIGFISYFLAVVLIRRLTGAWIIWDVDRDIRQGTLSPKLLHPIDPAHYLFTRILAFRLSQIPIIGPPVIIAAWLLGAQYDLSPATLLLTVGAIFGAFLIEFMAQMALGMSAFWITQASALGEGWLFLRALLSGWIVPIDLFPPAVTAALFYLPFRYMLSLPVEILLGRLSLGEIGQAYLIQYSWAIGFFILFRLLWRRGLKHYSAVGA